MALHSLVRNLVAKRANAVSSQHDPVQWSDNSQLAINNGTQLTILDPRLPTFDKELIQEIDGVKLLDPKSLYNINNILHLEVMESLPIKRFVNITIETLDEPFHTLNQNDTMIVSHKWTKSDPRSRNNHLVVLFNTGEVLIFQRESVYCDKYTVKCAVADFLIRDLELNIHEVDSQVVASTSSDYFSVLVSCFDVTTNDNGQSFLSIMTNNGDLLMYEIESQDNLRLISKADTAGAIKLNWSPWKNNESHLAAVKIDNSIDIYTLRLDNDIEVYPLTPATRFLNSQMEWFMDHNVPVLISVFTGRLRVSKFEADKTITSEDYNLNTPISVASLVTHSTTKGIIDIVLSYEDGKFASIAINLETMQFSRTEIDRSLNDYVAKCLLSFQLENSNADDDGDDETNIAFEKKYLNQSIEGSLVSCGAKLSTTGIFVIVFKIIPKNIFYYETAANSVLRIAFVDVFSSDNNHMAAVTPIASLNNMWVKNLAQIPVVPENPTLDSYKEFINQAQAFKTRNFNKEHEMKIQDSRSDLYSQLLLNFHSNSAVKELQTLINYNYMLESAIKKSEFAQDKDICGVLDSLSKETAECSSWLELLLINVIFDFVANTSLNLQSGTSDTDQFVAIKLAHKIPGIISSLPERAQITVGTRFFQESFEASLQDMDVDETMIESTSNHKWTQCQLTKLPLMQLHSKKDELSLYNYILEDHSLMPAGSLVSQLIDNVQYCYVTGNKAYKS